MAVTIASTERPSGPTICGGTGVGEGRGVVVRFGRNANVGARASKISFASEGVCAASGTAAARTRPAKLRFTVARLRLRLRGVLGRNRVVGTLDVPDDRCYVPAGLVPDELDRVDAADERLGVGRIVARFVRREDLTDVSEAVRLSCDLLLEERSRIAFGLRRGRALAHALLKAVDVENREAIFVRALRGDQLPDRQEDFPHELPFRLGIVAVAHGLVERGDHGVDGRVGCGRGPRARTGRRG